MVNASNNTFPPYKVYYYTNDKKDCYSSFKTDQVKSQGKGLPVNVEESNNEYFVYASVPGYLKSQLSIDFDESNNSLTLASVTNLSDVPQIEHVKSDNKQTDQEKLEAKSDDEPKKVPGNLQYHINEFNLKPRQFNRTLVFENRIDPAGIVADLKDGILKLTLSKQAKDQKHFSISIM